MVSSHLQDCQSLENGLCFCSLLVPEKKEINFQVLLEGAEHQQDIIMVTAPSLLRNPY